MDKPFISRLTSRIVRQLCVLIGQRITVVFEKSSVKHVIDAAIDGSSFERTEVLVESLQLKKGWYMLEVSGNGATIGSNLSLNHKADSSLVGANTDKSGSNQFNILLGSHAISKRIIRIDSQIKGTIFILDGRVEHGELPLITICRVSNKFAVKRMNSKLTYASTQKIQSSTVDSKYSASKLFETYNRLMERHVNPVTYRQWLEDNNTGPLDNLACDREDSERKADEISHALLKNEIVAITVIGEIANIKQLDSICMALIDLVEKCSVHILFYAQSKVLSYIENKLNGKTSVIAYSLLAPDNKINNPFDESINSVACDYRIFIGNGVQLNHEVFTKQIFAARSSKNISLVYTDHDAIDEFGKRSSPVFKPEWNAELLLNTNYIGYCFLIRNGLLKQLGGWVSMHDQSSFYDIYLKSIDHVGSQNVRRIPEVLWHKYVGIDGRLPAENKGYLCQDYRDVLVLDSYLTSKRGSNPDISINDDSDNDAGMVSSYVVDGQLDGTYKIDRKFGNALPSVDIIIPTRDRVDILKTCVSSVLEKTEYSNYRIVVIDNDSVDIETIKYFETISGDARVDVVQVPGEFNFSALNNRAVENSSADVIVLLNNDTEVIGSKWLHEMAQQATKEDVGCVGAKLIYSNGRIQHGGVILGLKGMAGHAHRFLPRTDDGYCGRLKLSQDVTAVTAACLAVKRTVYNEVNGLDEVNLKVAYNDVDFCLRCREAGYRNIWTPYAELYHHESVSRGSEDTPEKARRFRSEYKYMLERWNTQELWDPAYNPNLSKDLENFSLAA